MTVIAVYCIFDQMQLWWSYLSICISVPHLHFVKKNEGL